MAKRALAYEAIAQEIQNVINAVGRGFGDDLAFLMGGEAISVAAELRDNPELVRQAYLAGDFHLDR